MPDREWLINTLHSLNPNHAYFKYSKSKDEAELKKENIIKE